MSLVTARCVPCPLPVPSQPHDWLLYQVSGVVHHGGAGTTSAGLRAGNPTFICPFFGDQHFWAEMVYRAGVGPKGCPIVDLTLEKLMAALKLMRDQETIEKATALGAKMNAEDGVRRGIESFNHNLPLANMLCEVSLFDQQSSRIATTFCADCGLKMCVEVDQILHRPGSSRVGHKRAPFRPARYGVVDPLSSIGNLLTRRRLSREALMKHGHSKRIERDLIAQPHPASASASSLSAGEVSRRTGDTEASPESVANIEAAFVKAERFMHIWREIDKNGDRSVHESELHAFMSPQEAKEFFEGADHNNDQLLTFTEFAWKGSKFNF